MFWLKLVFTILGVWLLLCYLLVDRTRSPGGHLSEDTNGAVQPAFVRSSAASPGPEEMATAMQSPRPCRGMKPTRLWPSARSCEGRTNCGRRIAQGERYSLPQTVVDGVRYLLLFVGIGRSGSSIVGSIIDAHPNAVVANQYQLVDGLVAKPALHSTKAQVFSRLVGFSLKQAREKAKNFGKGYSLKVGNETMHIDESTQLTVIGDKGAGMLPSLYMMNKDQFVEEYKKLKRTVEVPIKIVQVRGYVCEAHWLYNVILGQLWMPPAVRVRLHTYTSQCSIPFAGHTKSF